MEEDTQGNPVARAFRVISTLAVNPALGGGGLRQMDLSTISESLAKLVDHGSLDKFADSVKELEELAKAGLSHSADRRLRALLDGIDNLAAKAAEKIHETVENLESNLPGGTDVDSSSIPPQPSATQPDTDDSE